MVSTRLVRATGDGGNRRCGVRGETIMWAGVVLPLLFSSSPEDCDVAVVEDDEDSSSSGLTAGGGVPGRRRTLLW
jgi:hypothetical protein